MQVVSAQLQKMLTKMTSARSFRRRLPPYPLPAVTWSIWISILRRTSSPILSCTKTFYKVVSIHYLLGPLEAGCEHLMAEVVVDAKVCSDGKLVLDMDEAKVCFEGVLTVVV